MTIERAIATISSSWPSPGETLSKQLNFQASIVAVNCPARNAHDLQVSRHLIDFPHLSPDVLPRRQTQSRIDIALASHVRKSNGANFHSAAARAERRCRMARDTEHKITLTRGRGKPRNEELSELIRHATVENCSLDLVHVTPAGIAADIFRGLCQIETAKCQIFKENLVYFFIGRAAFRPEERSADYSNLTMFPAAFVVKPDSLPPPAHVYPFDSGAAASGRFRGVNYPGVYLDDYRLDADLDTVRKFIGWAYGGYREYLEFRLRPELDKEVSKGFYVAKSCIQIARLAGSRENQPDLRAASIEVAYRQHVPLKGHALFAVLPDMLLEREDVRTRVKDIQLRIRTYPWVPGKTAEDFFDHVSRAVRTGLRGK